MHTPTLAIHDTVALGPTVQRQPALRRAILDALWRCELMPLMIADGADSKAIAGKAAVYVDVFEEAPQAQAERLYQHAVEANLRIMLFSLPEVRLPFAKPSDIFYFEPDVLSETILRRLLGMLPLYLPSPSESLHAVSTAIIPASPDPYLAHPPFLPRRLAGRENELNVLNRWVITADPIMLIEGESGSGKSTLLWHWVLGMIETEVGRRFAGYIVWDFAESNGGFDNFTRHALAYVGGDSLENVSALSIPERIAALQQLLHTRPYFLALENIECLLTAYERFDASYLSERMTISPAQDWLRRATTNEYREFLTQLPNLAASKVLVSSRLVPRDWQSDTGALLQGVRRIQVTELTAGDAIAIFEQAGVSGNAATLAYSAEAVGNHALSLMLAITRAKEHSTGFPGWLIDGARGAAALRLAGKETYDRIAALVGASLDGLSGDARTLLNVLVALRYPINYSALHLLNPHRLEIGKESQHSRTQTQSTVGDVRSVDADVRLHTILRELEARELLLWGRGLNRYAVHPLIRTVLYARWTREERERAFKHVQAFLEQVDLPETAHDVSDMRASIEIYNSLIQLNDLQAAARCYRDQISPLILTRFSDYQLAHSLLLPLFPQGIGNLPDLDLPSEQSYFAHELALILANLGQRQNALILLGQAFSVFIATDDPMRLCTALINYAALLNNQPAMRVRLFELARRLARAIHDVENTAVASFFLLRNYVDMGQWIAAAEAYEEFSHSPARYRTLERQAAAERHIARMLIYQDQDATNALNLAMEFAKQSESIQEERAILSLWGELSLLQHKRPDAAEQFFRRALEMTLDAPQSALIYRGGLARACAMLGREQEARQLIAQGVKPLFAAMAFQRFDDKDSAIRAAKDAYREAWGDGAPFSQHWELAQAQHILEKYEVPLPNMAPFDAERLTPVPHEMEIRSYVSHLERGSVVQIGGSVPSSNGASEPEDAA